MPAAPPSATCHEITRRGTKSFPLLEMGRVHTKPALRQMTSTSTAEPSKKGQRNVVERRFSNTSEAGEPFDKTLCGLSQGENPLEP